MPKKVLITGASSGFGLGSAIELARAGHIVIAAAETWPQVRNVRADAAAAGSNSRRSSSICWTRSTSLTRASTTQMCLFSTRGSWRAARS